MFQESSSIEASKTLVSQIEIGSREFHVVFHVVVDISSHRGRGRLGWRVVSSHPSIATPSPLLFARCNMYCVEK